LIFWEANCLRRFIRLSSSLRLFDISPSLSGVSQNTDGPEGKVPLEAAAAAADMREVCGTINPCLSTFLMGVHRRRLVGGRFGECKTSNGSKSKGRLSVTHAILLGLYLVIVQKTGSFFSQNQYLFLFSTNINCVWGL
jgi:hypothetical protein